jgi:predicted nucleic acid-binding protein
VRIVICDTGPILHLHEAHALALLPAAGEVIVPPAVERELGTRVSNWSTSRPTWLPLERMSDEDARRAEDLMAIGGRP